MELSFKVAAAAAYSESTNALTDVSSTNDLLVPGFFAVTVDSSGRQDTESTSRWAVISSTSLLVSSATLPGGRSKWMKLLCVCGEPHPLRLCVYSSFRHR